MVNLPLAGAPHAEAGSRKGRFSYTCNRCNRCCRDKRIQVNPYEVARLARNRGVSTGTLIDRFIDPEQMALRQREDGTCVFLGNEGCTVHEDRPLVCRLYPLGRVVRGPQERWIVLPPAPGSEGVVGADGAVSDYVRQQGAIPYMHASEAYHSVIERYVAMQQGRGEAGGDDGDGMPPSTTESRDLDGARWILDSDAHLPRTEREEPLDVELHVEFLMSALCGE